MASSKPEFQGVVLKDSGINYCGLFKRRVVNTSSVAATQYYWLPTNRSGDIIDFRSNLMNGTFTSDTAALSNYPAGYGVYTDNWPTTKYLSYMNLYPFADLGQFKTGVDTFVAAGATNIVIPVLWTDIFDSYNTTGKRQDQNLNSSYEAKQNLAVDYVATTYPNVKISLKVMLYVNWGSVNKFWGESNCEKDIWGNYLRLGYDNTHPSLADTAAGSGRSMMKDFFQKVVVYYNNRLGSKLNWIAPVITEQAEYGFNYENGLGTAKPSLFGYSTATINGFRGWLPTQYANPGALNTAWGTSYSTFSEAVPPSTGLAFGSASTTDLNALFASRRGVDFYQYRVQMLYDFANDCKTIVDNYSSAKFVLCFGGVSPNDDLVPLRGSYDVIKWGEVSDGLKTAFASDNRFENTTMTLDFVQNYPKKIMTELHHIDYYGNGNNPLPVSIVKANMIQSGKDAIINGAKDLLFIGMPQNGDWFAMLKQIFDTLKPEFLRNNDGARQTAGAATINLGELLYNGNITGGIQKWQAGGGRSDNRINITFTNTTALAGDANYPVTFQVKNNQMYYIRQNDIKNSYYGFREDNDSRPYTTLQTDYNTNRVPILLSAFGITYPSGAKTKSTIEIIDQAGVKWVKVVQLFGVNPFENGVNYSNNHPEYRYLEDKNIAEDCRFWLPIPASGGYYDVTITVYDASCRFDVYHADSNAPGGIAYNENKTPTAAGSTETIRINRSQILQTNVNQRVIKINNNRWA